MKSFKNIIKQKSKKYYLEAKYNSDFTECLEIGYFTNNKGEVQIEQFPETVKKVPSELPKFITSLELAFYKNENSKIEGIQHWSTSNITNMNYMFSGAENFDQDISRWTVKKVTELVDFAPTLSDKNKPHFK
ncbi:BspA family leucine-rich repeat surface protein [Mycoplasma sp. HU2014]|uniref:BspA family leucine-rich repeat surface protein n=1 Tax=Mycoplasma sp. HU2014 TaxID=1664275 RepID=UPI00191539A7|nr:BspA family leucine-rich repeat surface protein [Mycoplasma sp. HU2014]